MSIENDFEQDILTKTKKEFEANIKIVKKEIMTGITVEIPEIRGVSDLHFKAIAVELGNLDRFTNDKQVVAFSGLDPSIRESGSSVRSKSKLSKRGSKTMRYFLFQSA